jgi:hypothetical protein
MNVVQVKETMSKGLQSVDYECIVNVESDTNDSDVLRVNIKRDCYDRQSHWNVEAWRQNGWVFVTSIPVEEAASAKVSYVQKNPDIELFQYDRDRLLEFACAVVF